LTKTHRGKSEAVVAQASLSPIMDDNRAKKITRTVQASQGDDFARKAWFQADKNNSARVWACPKDHNLLSDRQFPVLAQTYGGDKQTCLVGLTRLPIRQKAEGGREETMPK